MYSFSSSTPAASAVGHPFIVFALSQGALRFGDFTLKSGRPSPYFFNLGQFSTGPSLRQLGQFYAQAIVDANLEVDMLFGPAYKGIPLVSSIAMALSDLTQRAIPFCFDRKEKKDHGEKGNWVGAPLRGRVLIVDDVISAGTTAHALLPQLHAMPQVEPAGVLVALDRGEQERSNTARLPQTAAQSIHARYAVPVISLIGFHDLMQYLQTTQTDNAVLARMHAYYRTYGVPTPPT